MAFQISRLYDFVAGTKIYSAQVDAELDQLVLAHNYLDTRVDTIITTPAEGVTAQEIIDARSGSATLLARLNGMMLKNGTRAMEYLTVGSRAAGTVGFWSAAIGINTIASGQYSFAQGTGCEATGNYAHAEGQSSHAHATGAHGEGAGTALGVVSHAEGNGTISSGLGSHTEGGFTQATGDYSHASGYLSIALGSYSHAQGLHTKARGASQTAIGKYNIEDTLEAYSFIVGGGTDDTSRANIFTMDWSGNFAMFGDAVFTNGIGPVVTSPDGTKYRIIVANGGALSTEVVT